MTDRNKLTKQIIIIALAVTCLAWAKPCAADLTAFVGTSPTPSNRFNRGFSLGLSFTVFGFEFEYSNSIEDKLTGAPSLKTGMINVMLKTPRPISGFRFYATMGGGLYKESLGLTHETHGGANGGGGVIMTLAGPLRVRVDYRMFTLGGNAKHKTSQRIYSGLNLAF